MGLLLLPKLLIIFSVCLWVYFMATLWIEADARKDADRRLRNRVLKAQLDYYRSARLEKEAKLR